MRAGLLDRADRHQDDVGLLHRDLELGEGHVEKQSLIDIQIVAGDDFAPI